jgi:UDP-N-acetylmuramyl pentapeptide phosphotransferase/UDP-N-acetylglucosamine-1-phosphate transferase
MGIQVGLFDQSAWLIGVTLIIGIGAVNAFNFMDGINGITGLYSLVNMATLYFINSYIISFTSTTLITYVLLSVVIFLFFNFRPRARCFAGDVGSVTLAFVQIFLILQLIYVTNNYGWSLLLLLYGIDSIVTIIYRLKRKENIFKAHRSHLYQYFSNELGVPHLMMSLSYGLIQLVCNIFLILFLTGKPLGYYLVFILISGLAYVVVREKVLRRIGARGLFSSRQ